MQTTLVVGDWSDDGHGKTASVTFEHNLSRVDALADAYQAGSIKLNIEEAYWDREAQETRTRVSGDVMYDHVANEYQDSSIPNNVVQALMNHGIGPEGDATYEAGYVDESKYCVCGPEGYARIWMEIAKLGNPELVFEQVQLDTINVGGYGCFN